MLPPARRLALIVAAAILATPHLARAGLPLALPRDEEPAAEAVVPDEVPDRDADLSEEVDRWVLHDVLLEGHAQRPLRRRPAGRGGAVAGPVPDDAVGAVGLDPSALAMRLQVPAWTTRVRAERAEALLFGEPTQRHGQGGLALDIPGADHRLVDLYIDYFTGRGRLFFQTWLGRAQRYVPLMQEILGRHGLPKDLVYLAMIESGFSARAVSTAAASGFWQFMGPTGRLFGLGRSIWLDERRDFVRSTEAAARYLARLHAEMGDWHLAWASYNAGEGRIRRALARTGSRSFWELIEAKNSIARETAHYVPKIIAAAMVAKDAKRYGFVVDPTMVPLDYEEIPIEGAYDLKIIARRSGVSLTSLRELNPSLLHDVTPPRQRFALRVPRGRAAPVTALLANMPPAQRLAYYVHKVRRGETLSGIARRYHAQTAAIIDLNDHVQARRLRPGRELLIPSMLHAVPVAARARTPTRVASATRAHRPRARHVVATGETLWSIARRYGTTVDHIRGRRTGRGRLVAVGEVLEID